jgi:hypothetical protein
MKSKQESAEHGEDLKTEEKSFLYIQVALKKGTSWG